MRGRPFFIRNPSGACVPYALANLLHFYKDDKGGRKAHDIIQAFPALEDGYLISEIDSMVKSISNDLVFAVQYYDELKTGMFADYFKGINQLEEASDYYNEQSPENEFFFLYLFFIEKNRVQHAVSAYLSLDNMALVVMDSQKTGSVEVFEIEQFFAQYRVYGVGQIALQNERKQRFKMPILRSQIELFR